MPALVITALLSAVVVLLASSRPASAPFCPPGTEPAYHHGFAVLYQELGEAMGEPLECQHSEPNSGEVFQRTTRGLAYYLPGPSTSAFTNGWERWALTREGIVYWTGSNLGPPASARLLPPRTARPHELPFDPDFDPYRYIGQGNRYNCSHFSSQAQAQAVLRADPHDPNRLDRARTGTACRGNPPPYDLTPVVPRPCHRDRIPLIERDNQRTLRSRGCTPSPAPTPAGQRAAPSAYLI